MNKLLLISTLFILTTFNITAQTIHFTGAVSQNDTAIDTNGNIINVGAITNDVNFSPSDNNFEFSTPETGDVNAYITKISDAGNILWTKVLKTEKITTPIEISRIQQVVTDSNNNIYVAGTYRGIVHLNDNIILNSTSDDNYNSFIIKFDTDGNILWHKEYLDHNVQQNGFAYEFIHQIKVTNNKLDVGITLEGDVDFGFKNNEGNQIITQSSKNGQLKDVVILQYNLDGTEENIHKIEGVDVGFNFLDNEDLLFVDFSTTTNSTTILARNGTSKVLKVINLLQDGTINRTSTLLTNNNFSTFFPVKIALDSNESIFISGRFSGSVDFNPDPTINENVSEVGSKTDIFILKLDNEAKFLWSKQIPNPSISFTQALRDMQIVNDNPIIYGNVRVSPLKNYDLSGEDNEATTIKGNNGFFVSEFSGADGAFSKTIFFKYYDTSGNIPQQNFGISLEFLNDTLYFTGPLLSNGTVEFLDKSITLDKSKFGSFISKFSLNDLETTLSTKNNYLIENEVFVYQYNNQFLVNKNTFKIEVFNLLGKAIINNNLKPGFYLVKALDKNTKKYKIFKKIIQ